MHSFFVLSDRIHELLQSRNWLGHGVQKWVPLDSTKMECLVERTVVFQKKAVQEEIHQYDAVKGQLEKWPYALPMS